MKQRLVSMHRRLWITLRYPKVALKMYQELG